MESLHSRSRFIPITSVETKGHASIPTTTKMLSGWTIASHSFTEKVRTKNTVVLFDRRNSCNLISNKGKGRAGSWGPRAPRHTICPGPPYFSNLKSSETPLPTHCWNGGFTKTDHWPPFPQRI